MKVFRLDNNPSDDCYDMTNKYFHIRSGDSISTFYRAYSVASLQFRYMHI